MSANIQSNALKGWTSSPDGRGTLNILWACVATIFLSTWSAICLNVPKPSDTIWTNLKRKFGITLLSILGPEFLLCYALSERQSAGASVACFKQLRQDDKWTLKHAFFADMGGFILQTSDDVSFFLDTKQILWLLKHHVISTTQFETSFLLDSKTINDRNKSDLSVRVIAISQALWFCVNVAARGIQGLAVTTLEINTIGIVVDSILVYYFWKNKPADVESTEVVKINITLSEMILLEEDEAARTRPYFRTPLDFAAREPWHFGLLYFYLANIFKSIRPHSWRRKKKESLGRRSDFDLFPVSGVFVVIGYLAGLAFLGTNFIAWNFHFPTPIERLLWRISSGGLFGLVILAGPGAELVYSSHRVRTMQENTRKHRKTLEDTGPPGEKAGWKDYLVYKFRILAMKVRNNSPENDPNLDVSLHFASLGMQIVMVYVVFRAYILVEDVIAFRALPVEAYSTVDWWKFVPHIG